MIFLGLHEPISFRWDLFGNFIDNQWLRDLFTLESPYQKPFPTIKNIKFNILEQFVLDCPRWSKGMRTIFKGFSRDIYSLALWENTSVPSVHSCKYVHPNCSAGGLRAPRGR